MKRVVVTGASGYIGGQTCIELKAHGYHVTGVDLRPLPEHLNKFVDHFIQKNISNVADQISDTEGIVHCAGTSLVGPSMKDPALYYQNNVGATARLLEILGWNGWHGRFVFSSSASVYGIPKTTPIPETSVVNPINPYGRSKAFCEQLITDSARAYQFSAVTLRYFNACGADSRGRHGQEPDATHIFARIFEAIKHNRPIEIYGNEYPTRDGTCVRDYIHVMDLAEAHRRALEKSLPPSNHIFNLGTRHGYSVLEIVNRIKDILKSDAIVEFRAPRAGDPPELIASSESFKNFFEWEPTHSDLNTIIKSLKKWYHV